MLNRQICIKCIKKTLERQILEEKQLGDSEDNAWENSIRLYMNKLSDKINKNNFFCWELQRYQDIRKIPEDCVYELEHVVAQD
jgi:NAD+--asparagine ADP-ribosyltransferase